MVGIFYVLAWRREKSDFKLRISGIADSYMPMAYRERRWWGGWNADLSFQVKTNPECCGSVDLAANGSQRRVADRSRCIRIYRRIRTTKIWLVQYQHNPQLSAPIRDSRHMPEGIWIRDEFLSVILCNIKRYQAISKDPRAICSVRVLPEHRKVRGNPRCFKFLIYLHLYCYTVHFLRAGSATWQELPITFNLFGGRNLGHETEHPYIIIICIGQHQDQPQTA